MASQQMPRRDPSKKVKERDDDVETYGKKSFGEKERELVSDRARPKNIVKEKEVEEGRESGGGKYEKFETSLGEKDKLEVRTRVVEGKVWNEEEKIRNIPPRGKVEAEKGRAMEKTTEEAQRRKKGETKEGDGEEQGRGREQNEQPSLEDISKYRGQVQEKAMNAVEAAKEKYEKKRAKQAQTEASKERNKQAKDFTREKGRQEGNLEGDKVDKTRGGINGENVGEEAVEIGKIASKVAADLRDRAIVTGWSAAQYSTEMTVEGTKAATTIVEEAVEYLGQKVYELAAKSMDTATGLAAATGENAKEYTARKKEEAERALEVKRETQNQANETVAEIGDNMVKPAHQSEGGGGVLNSIGETIAEIAETTRIMVSGEGKEEKPKSPQYEHADMKLH
ncbi:Seed biotin-containing protein [Vigna angularis]|uniref:Seed biotin-containing protein n=2 Tax=Phaseolus angularis TaxID=3914 RepID=A0A8T0KC32_PHAAN|nr:seed biotin-containing protein SBP65-like [Vigna angularis]KAG2397111.1 Seed biotin-containing protein [Vigna angularis]BAT90032.1 hypothetical protein VIGAN_06119700 [Vigna angularis var. angularis]